MMAARPSAVQAADAESFSVGSVVDNVRQEWS